MEERPSRNIGIDLVRVTEATAIAAGRWIGVGNREKAHNAATKAMHDALNLLDVDGLIVIGEEGRLGEHSYLDTGQHVGTGEGALVDVAIDPIDGTMLVIKGHPGAISLVAVAPRGTMLAPPPSAVYMDKIVVDRQAAGALVPECMDAPAAWTLALVARVKDKPVRDLTVTLLDRPRHEDLIEEIRAAGARILLRDEGDAEGALEAAMIGTETDILMGVGGVSEGVIAACAVKALGGMMLARMAPQSQEERDAIVAAGLDPDQIMNCHDIVKSNDIYFAATGVTSSPLLRSISYSGNIIETHSLLIRGKTGTRRIIHSEQSEELFPDHLPGTQINE